MTAMQTLMSLDMTPTRKHVLVTIAYLASLGKSQLSQMDLVELTSLSERTVRRAVTALEAMGLIERSKAFDAAGRREPDCYEVTLPDQSGR